MSFHFDEAAARDHAAKDGITHFTTGIAVVNDGQVLVVERVPHDFQGGNYELPGGGIDEGETVIDSVKRELKEETGLDLTEITGMIRGFDYPAGPKKLVRQFNFVVTTTGYEVQLDPNEHVAYKWVGADGYQGLVMTPEMKLCLDHLFKN